jgi:hypothetical protein
LRSSWQKEGEKLALWAETIVYESIEGLAMQHKIPLTLVRPLPYTKEMLESLIPDHQMRIHDLEDAWEASSSTLHSTTQVDVTDSTSLRGKATSILPSYHENGSLSPRAWSSNLLEDARCLSLACSLHGCRPSVCHKGKAGAMGVCRLRYWHWVRVPNGNGTSVYRRVKGKALTEDLHGEGSNGWFIGKGVDNLHPRGKFFAIRLHHFHTSTNPSILVTARANHDLQLLVRIPTIGNDTPSWLMGGTNMVQMWQEGDTLSCVIEELHKMQAIMDTAVGDAHDAAGYCTDYTTKVAPSSEGIFGLLKRAIEALQDDPKLKDRFHHHLRNYMFAIRPCPWPLVSFLR